MIVGKLFMLVIFLSIAVASNVHANDKAKEAFAKGIELFEQEQYKEAAQAFEQAMKYSPTYRILYNIAQAQAASKQYGLALETFETYLAQGGDEISTQRVDETIREMDRLKALVGSISFENEPQRGEIYVNGIKRGDLPLLSDLRVTAGIAHEILIKVDGEEFFRGKLKVGGGAITTLKVENELPPDAQTPKGTEQTKPKTTHVPSAKGLKIGIITSSGLAVVAGGMGIVFWAVANSKMDDFTVLNNDIGNGNFTTEDIAKRQKINDDITRLDGLSLGMYIGAGVMAATSLVLTIVHVKKKKKNESLVWAPTGLEVRF